MQVRTYVAGLPRVRTDSCTVLATAATVVQDPCAGWVASVAQQQTVLPFREESH
jgi:hypothetical protein